MSTSEKKAKSQSNTQIAEYMQEMDNGNARAELPLHDQNSIKKLLEVISSGKPYDYVLRYIKNELEESVRVTQFFYELDCFFADGAYAISRAVEGKVGFAKQKGEKGISGGTNPPQMINVQFADGTSIKVPFGKISLPSFGKDAFIDMRYNPGEQKLHLSGQCEKRFVAEMDEIYNKAKRILEVDSIYKGQAVRYEKGNQDPTFINLNGIDKKELYLTSQARFSTQPIEARIEKTEQCIANGIDIKFGVLLEGVYGTGKTLYAFKLAKKAIENGWTFIYCKNAEDTLDVMKVSHRYCRNGKGVVLFIEDIDKILDKRDVYTNEISLLMDGGESKDLNLITIFTTNHITKIDPTFLRGKRIGSIVTLTHPDLETAEVMLKDGLKDLYGRTCLKGGITKAAQKIVDYKIVPAFIAEIVDMVKSHLIFSGAKTVTELDVVNAIESYQRQIDIATLKEEVPSVETQLGTNMGDLMNSKIREANKTLQEDIEYIKEVVQNF